ncbi:NAD(P)-binding protein [Lophium mytilinum]|uniref:NAD(P)-binding protein n=1 Tax=Lophium mytilinum TaxID=390894 RepID=A0A6A6QIT4_9PEZI|nr:NAD(P)-binding protein [Lophium mytilinum]
MGTTWSQMWPPTPTLTEKNLPSQTGKVFLITGGASGIGLALAHILYAAGDRVYIVGRSEANGSTAISSIQDAFLNLNLSDLSTIAPAVAAFQAKENHLHVLFNNAGVSLAPLGSTSAQSEELMMATNCLGPYLLTQLLLPSLVTAAQDPATPPHSVRVVWTSSIAVDTQAPVGGLDPADLAPAPTPAGAGSEEQQLGWYLKQSQQIKYAVSKLGNWYHAAALARQVGKQGVLSVTQNPGNLTTNLTQHMPRLVVLTVRPLLYESRYGAYTALWAGLSGELGEGDQGAYVVPWGRRHPQLRGNLVEACKSVEEGGKGRADGFAGGRSKRDVFAAGNKTYSVSQLPPNDRIPGINNSEPTPTSLKSLRS